jgi:hypothetical protein
MNNAARRERVAFSRAIKQEMPNDSQELRKLGQRNFTTN